MRGKLKRLWRSVQGATAIEFALLGSVVSIVALAVVTAVTIG